MGIVAKVYISAFTWWFLILALPLHALLCGLSIRSIRHPKTTLWAIACAVPLLLSGYLGGYFWVHTASIAAAIGLLLAGRSGHLRRAGPWSAAAIGAGWLILQGLHQGRPMRLIHWLFLATSPIPARFW